MSVLRAWQNQRGLSLVTALFILVVLSALGGYMLLLGGVQSQTTVMALQGARAYHAARSGLEWGGFQSVNSGTCAEDSFVVEGFTVTVECRESSFVEKGQSHTIFRLTSLAEWGLYGSEGYVSRQLTAKILGSSP